MTNSNTWLLENEFGWTGLLAEPNPFWHADLARNRRVPIEHRCVAGETGRRVTFLTTDDSDPELGGIASFASGDHFADLRRRGGSIEVETISLDDLLAAHDAPAVIDYLSVDTEGSEYEILRAFDFDAHTPTLLSVEQNGTTAPQLQALLTGRGYTQVFPEFSQWDAWYVSADLRRRPRRQIYAPKD